MDLHTANPEGSLDAVLPQPQRVRIPDGYRLGKSLTSRVTVPKRAAWAILSLGKEPVGDSTLVEDLKGA